MYCYRPLVFFKGDCSWAVFYPILVTQRSMSRNIGPHVRYLASGKLWGIPQGNDSTQIAIIFFRISAFIA